MKRKEGRNEARKIETMEGKKRTIRQDGRKELRQEGRNKASQEERKEGRSGNRRRGGKQEAGSREGGGCIRLHLLYLANWRRRGGSLPVPPSPAGVLAGLGTGKDARGMRTLRRDS